MNSLKDRAADITAEAHKLHKPVWNPTQGTPKNTTPRAELQAQSSKLTSLEEAIRQSGLRDGMTISFHHHFRGGDKVVNLVVAKLAEMGYRDLHLAASSLNDVHEPLIGYIRQGVITRISTSGLRGELARAISMGLMEEPVVFRSHGARGAAIANGELHIDVAFLGASSSDPLGNACGYSRSPHAKSICGSLGYALPDAQYADKVVILTDDLVAYPNTPNAISEHHVDFVVQVDSVGDSTKISSGAIRDTKNPRDILLAKQAAKVIVNSGYFKDGFSIQTGSGGASLAVVKYLRDSMLAAGVKASFALGGITAHMVKLHEEGLIERLVDVQSFDKVAAESLRRNAMHKEVSANFWGEFHQSLFNGLNRPIMMARLKQPLSTIRRIQVAVPSRAQFEPGFYRWLERISRLAENLECRTTFHGRDDTLALIRDFTAMRHPTVRADYAVMTHWNELPRLAASIAEDHLFIVIGARKGTVSYKNALEHLPEEITDHFSGKNLLIVFPDQHGDPMDEMTFAQPQHQEERSAYVIMREWVLRQTGRLTARYRKDNNDTEQ